MPPYSPQYHDEGKNFLIILTVIGLIAAVVLHPLACTAPERSKTTLENYGFTEAQCSGYAWFECGEDYTYATKCGWTNPTGKHVDGAVCCGVMKGCTAKF